MTYAWCTAVQVTYDVIKGGDRALRHSLPVLRFGAHCNDAREAVQALETIDSEHLNTNSMLAAAAATTVPQPGRRLAARPAAAMQASSRTSAAAAAALRPMRCPATAGPAAAAAAAWAPPPLVCRGAASRQPAVLCRARQQQPEIEPDAAGSGLQADWPAADGSAESSQAQPPQTKDFWQSLDSSLAAARKEFLQNLLELPQTARGAIELLPQMHYPTPRFIARYTTQARCRLPRWRWCEEG